MEFGNIEIDPAVNPAVLDTATWDPERAWRIVSTIEMAYWRIGVRALLESREVPVHGCCIIYRGSCARCDGSTFFLAQLRHGQHVFVEIRDGRTTGVLGRPVQMTSGDDRTQLAMYAADAETVRRYVSAIRPDKGPRAMGAVPRLGIGCRMSTSVWPGVWRAMDECRFAANAIQNSVRELNLLEDVRTGRPPRSNYLYGFGTLDEGHTGSTFEGLWLAGVIDALKTDTRPVYGADADHITIRRGPGGIERAERIIQAARDYTFFTLDVSDIVDYQAAAVPSADQRCFTDKYGAALDVVEELAAHIKHCRGDVPFDLELSIDECPPRMDTALCLTTEAELRFLISEMRRRSIPVTHIAPNIGVVKGQDYDAPGGLAELENRLGRLHGIAEEHGIMLDIHSGDDLRAGVRQAIGRVTRGHNHFKVSPSLQVIFGEVLHNIDPERFRVWWDDTLAYARREAAAGSDFAAQCLRDYERSGHSAPSPHHAVFHHYNFASVGKRDAEGRFVLREQFYSLPPEFHREYTDRIRRFLCGVAADVFCLDGR